jgi:peptide/nickel transport system substrate-binding protein
MRKRKIQTNGLGKLERGLVNSYVEGNLSRREFLVRGSVLGLSTTFLGTVLAACGSDSASSDTTAVAGTDAPVATEAVAGTDAPPATEAVTEPPATEAVAAAGGIKDGGTLRVASQRPSGPIDPVAMDNLGAYTIAATSFEYLAGKGDGAALAPMLAESWSPNDDGTEWTFKLRAGVKWHDGTPVTSADVVATIERLLVGNLKSYVAPGAATAPDESTVVVKLLLADGQFPYQMSIYNPQSLITPAAYKTGTTLDGQPAGTGPFKLEKYDVATGATFVRNDDWWGGKPKLDKVEFIFSDDIDTQITGVLGGQADAIVQFAVVGGDALLTNPDLDVESIPGAAHRQLWMNVREGTFTDVKVRQAVALGINRQELLDVVLKGRGKIGNDHPIAPSYEFFDGSQPQRERDVEKAKALLKEAGKEGLAITMAVPKLQEIPQLAELIQSQLKDIGMDVTLNVISTDTFYDSWCKVYDSKTEPAGCDGGVEFGIVDYGNRGTPDVYLVKAYKTGEWNSSHYISEPFNAAVTEYQGALTLDGRKEAIKKVQAIASEDVPYVIPYFYDSLTARKKNVSGIVATGLGHFYLGAAGFTS